MQILNMKSHKQINKIESKFGQIPDDQTDDVSYNCQRSVFNRHQAITWITSNQVLGTISMG